jgi:phosphatidate phosphatase APP1
MEVKAYHGYGHTHNLVVYGHVFEKKPPMRTKYSGNIFSNIFQLLKLFFVKPLASIPIRVIWQDQLISGTTEKDGFFKIEWEATHEVAAGWHPTTVECLDSQGRPECKTEALVYVPHSTQFGFISDIDDTIMISHSATMRKRLVELFVKNPRTRTTFDNVGEHYAQLALAHTNPQTPNPFFYVSSSEWNLYDYLHEFFDYNKLPKGTFLLNQVKQWFELWKTGKTKHEGKLLRIHRILNAFPKQKFILFGDNTQKDPAIYAKLVERFPDRIHAVYIRNIVPAHEANARMMLMQIKKIGAHACLFNTSLDAIAHSKEIGLID